MQKAAALGRTVVLMSAPDISVAMGPGTFAELVELAARDYPDALAGAVFDCGDEAGLALAALRRGGFDIMIDLPTKTAAPIKEMASIAGIRVIEKTDIENPGVPVLDLASTTDTTLSVAQFLENTPS